LSGSPPKLLIEPENAPVHWKRTSSLGRSTGNMRKSTWSKSVKTAALAPMPSASVRITVNVNPGDLRNWRSA
jgi:hypothetical protein